MFVASHLLRAWMICSPLRRLSRGRSRLSRAVGQVIPGLAGLAMVLGVNAGLATAELRVGTAKVDVNPTQLPVLINGGMLTRSAENIQSTVNARAVVLDDQRERLAIVVVDSCMMSRELLDEAKHLAASRTQLRPDRILISATHTHTAPSSMGALGTEADPNYTPLLRQRLADAIVAAEQNLQPAEVGWACGEAADFTAVRRWVRRPDRVEVDPFGNPTVRANMHAARDPNNAIGPTGPEDPQLCMIGFRARKDGRPLALISNFSMHYFGDRAIGPDYFGRYCDAMEKYLANEASAAEPPLVLMSHGCSGDIWRRDYFLPPAKEEATIDDYTAGLVTMAQKIYGTMQFQPMAELKMVEQRLPMRYRVPDAQRLAWAEQLVAAMGDRPPKNNTEVYAREQVILHRLQSTEIVLQAIRIGDIAIASTPNETYALTGLKLKLQSPLPQTMVIELANGGDGYIPPPEQHVLGGYNTWAARTAGLEVTAEPRIVAASLKLLEEVVGQPRRRYEPGVGPQAQSILTARPFAYWRLDEFAPPLARDASGHHRQANLEPGTLFFLEGDDSQAFCGRQPLNRCLHFAGGRLIYQPVVAVPTFTTLFSFWNGMPLDGRPVSGWMFSRDFAFSTSRGGIHLGLGGQDQHPGKLLLQLGDGPLASGKTAVERWQWNQVALVCGQSRVQVFLNGQLEIDAPWTSPPATLEPSWFWGGRSDGDSNWEGRLDEIALFDRPLQPEQLQPMWVHRSPKRSTVSWLAPHPPIESANGSLSNPAVTR
jgi:hypothetical protein